MTGAVEPRKRLRFAPVTAVRKPGAVRGIAMDQTIRALRW